MASKTFHVRFDGLDTTITVPQWLIFGFEHDAGDASEWVRSAAASAVLPCTRLAARLGVPVRVVEAWSYSERVHAAMVRDLVERVEA